MNSTLNLILNLEKNMANNYSIFLNEVSNDYLYENIFSMFEDCSDMAREIYNFMYNQKLLIVDEVEESKRINLICKLEDFLQ